MEILQELNKTNKMNKKPANKHQHTSNDSNINHIPSKTKANVITKKKINAISTYNPFHIQYMKPLFNPTKPNTTLNKNGRSYLECSPTIFIAAESNNFSLNLIVNCRFAAKMKNDSNFRL